MWADALADVATLDSFAAEVARHREGLAHALLGLPRMSARLANDLSAYGNAIDAHANRVARFQSNLAAARAAAPRPERAVVETGATAALLAAATSTDLDPFAAALEDTLESAAATTVRVVARNHSSAVALASGLPLPWLALAVVRGKGSLAALARQRPRTSPRTPHAIVRRRSMSYRGTPYTRGKATSGQAGATKPRNAAEDLPPTGDARVAYALLRAQMLAGFLAEELADVANGIDGTHARARLADLAHGLTTTTRSQRGWNTHYELLDVNECVNEAVAAGPRCGFVTVTKQLGDVPPIFASRAEIVVLLTNIVENAVQAARLRHGDDGEVTVATAAKRGKTTITIADNGAGLPTESTEHLFKPFHALRDGHLGLGLAVARKLAANNSGTIALASAPANEAAGTVAQITFPRA